MPATASRTVASIRSMTSPNSTAVAAIPPNLRSPASKLATSVTARASNTATPSGRMTSSTLKTASSQISSTNATGNAAG